MTDTSDPSPPSANATALTMRRILIIAAYSLIVWFCVAMFIRFGGAAGQFTGWNGIWTYAATVVFTPPLNRLTRIIAGMRPQNMVSVSAVALTVTTSLEGVAMKWLPQIYGGDPAVIRDGAVWLLWAVGVGLGFAVWTSVTAGRRLEIGNRAPSIGARRSFVPR